jgi:hypothetical protein
VPLSSARLSRAFVFVTASPVLLLLFALKPILQPQSAIFEDYFVDLTTIDEELCRRILSLSGNPTELSLACQAGSSSGICVEPEALLLF